MVTGRVDEIKVLFAYRYTHTKSHVRVAPVRCRGRRALAETTTVHRARYTTGSGDRFGGVVVPTAATAHHACECLYRYGTVDCHLHPVLVPLSIGSRRVFPGRNKHGFKLPLVLDAVVAYHEAPHPSSHSLVRRYKVPLISRREIGEKSFFPL
jgi:hypothetical protein